MSTATIAALTIPTKRFLDAHHKIENLKARIDKLTAEMDAIKADVRAEMEADLLDTVEKNGKVIFRLSLVHNTRVDTKGLTKAYPELVKPFTSTSTSTRFTVLFPAAPRHS